MSKCIPTHETLPKCMSNDLLALDLPGLECNPNNDNENQFILV